MPEWFNNVTNQGDDIAGIVASVGEEITEFKPGDRVAAFHEIGAPGGSYAEYAVAWGHTTFHIPKTISFEGVISYSSFSSNCQLCTASIIAIVLPKK